MTSIPVRRLLLTTLLLSACAGDDEGPRVGGPDWLSARAEPVQLALTLDSANARTRMITPRGGLITATGADGTRYRLEIPRDALLADAEITVIPVANVGGLPLEGGSIAAVQLEPDGLRLMQPATLTITPRTEVPIEEQVAYGYFGNGQDAHLYPLEIDSERIEMTLLHFSGYGFGRAPQNDPGRKALQKAASYEARVSAELAEVISAERARQILGVGESPDQPLNEAFDDVSNAYYDEILRPLMKTAETDERMAICALTRYFTWLRQLTLLGGAFDDNSPTPAPGSREAESKRRQDEASASAVRIMQNAWEKAREREMRLCREEHDFGSISRLIAMTRSMILLGQIPEDATQEIFEEIDACLNFEVEFRSIFDNQGPEGVLFYYHVTSRVPAQLSLVSPPESGVLASAPLEYERFDVHGRPEAAVMGSNADEGIMGMFSDHSLSPAGTRPGSFRVHFIGWDMNLIESPATDCNGEDSEEQKEVAENFYVVISPGLPTEITRGTPVGRGLNAGVLNTESHAWARHWSRAHRSQSTSWPGGGGPEEDDNTYRIALEPVRDGGVWRVDFKKPDPGVNGWFLHEDGYLILRHTPK